MTEAYGANGRPTSFPANGSDAADATAAHGLPLAKGVADHERLLAFGDVLRRRQGSDLQRLGRVDFQKGDVARGASKHEAGRQRLVAFDGDDVDLVETFHHVAGGDDIAVGGDDDAGAVGSDAAAA